MAEPVASGDVGLAVVTGVVPCKVYFSSTASWPLTGQSWYQYADIDDGQSGHLIARPYGGARILWLADTSGGEQWALVRIGNPSGIAALHGTLSAALNQGSLRRRLAGLQRQPIHPAGLRSCCWATVKVWPAGPRSWPPTGRTNRSSTSQEQPAHERPWKFLPCPNCCGCVCYQDSVQNIDMADNYEVRSGSWLLGSALMPNCNIQTADSNALLINKNACGGDTPKFGYTAIVSMGVWQPGARLIGAYSDDDNYFYVEGANAQDSAANAGATSMRLVQRLAGVETVIGKRLMFTSPGEVTGSLGISWGPYGVRTAGLCPGFPIRQRPVLPRRSWARAPCGRRHGDDHRDRRVLRLRPGQGPLALPVQQHLQPLHGLSRMHAVQPGGWFHLRRVDVYAVGSRHVVAGLGPERRLLAGGRHVHCPAG